MSDRVIPGAARDPLGFLAAALLAITAPAAAAEDPAWRWSSACSGPMLSVEVQFDGKPIFTSPRPLCVAAAAGAKRRARSLTFTFRPNRPIRWAASREEEEMVEERNETEEREGKPRDAAERRRERQREQRREAAEAREPVRGRIWLAGTDPKAVLLGVSFSREEMLTYLMHTAYPDRPAQSLVAPGLFVLTTPVGEKQD